MKKKLVILLGILLAIWGMSTGTAEAGWRVDVSFGGGYGGYGSCYAPRYYHHRPVYYRPAPVYYAPRVVHYPRVRSRVVVERPVYVSRPVYAGPRVYRALPCD